MNQESERPNCEWPSRWQGRWIWSHDPGVALVSAVGGFAGGHEPSWAMLRREFDLKSVPKEALARLTADSRYVLYVNGVEAARGPARGNLRRLRYDVVDIAEALVVGRNVIAILARYFAHANAWWAPVPVAGQLGAGAAVFELQLPNTALVSDGQWLARPGRGWIDWTAEGVSAMPSECCDAREVPANWTTTDFDATGWESAVVLRASSMGFSGDHHPPSHPYGPMPRRSLSMLSSTAREAHTIRVASAPATHEEAPTQRPFDQATQMALEAGSLASVGLPFTVEASSEKTAIVIADFGEVVTGSVCLEVNADAGTRIDVAAVEAIDAEDRPAPSGEEAGFRLWTRGREDRYETASVYGFRALVLSIQSDEPVTVQKLSVQERVYPRPEGCYFECSDDLLNRVYDVGRRTVDLCSHDAYIDCPSREQRAWTGDAVVHQMVDLASNPDWGLARWHVEMAASPRPDGILPMALAGDIEHHDRTFIPDFSLHWIRSLHNLYRYTGDRELIARLLPVADRILRWFDDFTTPDGLVSHVTSWVLIDWSSVHVSGQSSALNALYARGLRDFAEMSVWLEDQGRARWARARIDRLSDGFENFWDHDRRLYVDHRVAGERERPVSQHSQAAALAAGLVPEDRQTPLAALMMDEKRLIHAAWQMAHGDARYPREGEGFLNARYLYKGPPPPWWDVEEQIVRAQPFFRYVVHDALAEIGREDAILSSCRDWGALLDRCPTSLSETWWGGTTCHGWSATPTRDLVTRILGITPAEPGFGRVRIAPRLGDLEWARGAVPSPKGLIQVRVEDGQLEIDSPVPIQLNTQEQSSGLSGTERALPSGSHRISLRDR